jgi:hypothetical protein
MLSVKTLEMEAIEHFEITQANVIRICEQFEIAEYPQLARIFKEATAQMEFDTEMLHDFIDFYQDYLCGDNAHGEVTFVDSYFPPSDQRQISKIVNDEHSLVDCHVLSMLALDNCLEIYNHLAGEYPPYNSSWILDLTCEASEAVALARTSTSMLNLYYEFEESRQELEEVLKTRQRPLDDLNTKEKAKRQRTLALATEIARTVWEDFPNARIGPLSQMITEVFADDVDGLYRAPEVAGPAFYGRVKHTNLKKHLQAEYPEKVTGGGRPTLEEQTNAGKISGRVNELLQELRDEPIVLSKSA